MTAATRDTDDAMCGINVMYDVGKILSAGGASDCEYKKVSICYSLSLFPSSRFFKA